MSGRVRCLVHLVGKFTAGALPAVLGSHVALEHVVVGTGPHSRIAEWLLVRHPQTRVDISAIAIAILLLVLHVVSRQVSQLLAHRLERLHRAAPGAGCGREGIYSLGR